MRRILILSIIGIFLAGSPSYSAKPDLRAIVNNLCAGIVISMSSVGSPNELIKFMMEVWFPQNPLFMPPSPHFKEFRTIAVESVLEQMAQGRPPLLAQIGIASIADLFGHPAITPDEFRKAIERATHESRPVTSRGSPGIHEIPWGEIPLNPKSPLLQGSIENFKRAGFGVYAVSIEAALEIQKSPLERDMGDAIKNGLITPTRDRIEEEILKALSQAAERYGCYVPFSEPRGVYLPSYFILATPPEFLLHELVHASQDVSWDLLGLIDFFYEHVRLLRPIKTTPMINHIFEIKKIEFLNATRDPDYRKTVWDRGQKLGMTTADWIYFFDFHRFAAELDSHRQAAILAYENSRKSAALESNHAIYEHVYEVYYKRRGNLSPFVESLWKNEGAVWSTIQGLNANRSYREK